MCVYRAAESNEHGKHSYLPDVNVDFEIKSYYVVFHLPWNFCILAQRSVFSVGKSKHVCGYGFDAFSTIFIIVFPALYALRILEHWEPVRSLHNSYRTHHFSCLSNCKIFSGCKCDGIRDIKLGGSFGNFGCVKWKCSQSSSKNDHIFGSMH